MKNALRAMAFVFCVSLSVGSFAEESGYQDKDLGVTFPAALAGLKYKGCHVYEQPGSGYSLYYLGDDLMKADIYVYDGGRGTIPDGIASQVIKDEMQAVIKGVYALERMGRYWDVKTLEEGIRATNGEAPKRQYLWARLSYAQNPEKGVTYRGPRLSDAYLTGAFGKFIKVRLTYKECNAAAGEETSRRFVEDLSKALGK